MYPGTREGIFCISQEFDFDVLFFFVTGRSMSIFNRLFFRNGGPVLTCTTKYPTPHFTSSLSCQKP